MFIIWLPEQFVIAPCFQCIGRPRKFGGMGRLCGAQKRWISRCFRGTDRAFQPKTRDLFRMKMMLAACLLLGVWTTSAGAIDLAELAPCKPAAARLCDHTGGMTWSNLMRCGATLAAHSWRIGNSCREVLRKYGQL
jgi:hypothetical protein